MFIDDQQQCVSACNSRGFVTTAGHQVLVRVPYRTVPGRAGLGFGGFAN